MSRRDDSSPAALLLFRAPWWVSAGLGVAVFILMRWIYPAMIKGNRLGEVLAQVSVKVAPLVAGFFFFLAVLSAFIAWRRRALVDGQNSLESLRALSWKEFEWMVGEAFRRQGYAVEESFGGGPDGGVDVVLRKYGRTTLVQCKHWKVFSVGVPVVRVDRRVAPARTRERRAAAWSQSSDCLKIVAARESRTGLPKVRRRDGASNGQTRRTCRRILLGLPELSQVHWHPSDVVSRGDGLASLEPTV